jgi:hypothetical protein
MLILCVFANAQNNSPRQQYYKSDISERKFDEKKWKELVQDFDYSEKPVEDYDEAFDPNQTNQNQNQLSPNSGAGGISSEFWAGLFQVIFIIVIVAVVAILLISMLGAGNIFAPKSRKIPTSSKNFSIETVEENIHQSDLDGFIRNAVEDKQYALAIRLYYLAIIKAMSLSKLIKWKRDKTNRSYLNEIRSTNLFKPFREVTRIFERVWYGEDKLNENEYLSIKPKFEQLVKAAQAKSLTDDRR